MTINHITNRGDVSDFGVKADYLEIRTPESRTEPLGVRFRSAKTQPISETWCTTQAVEVRDLAILTPLRNMKRYRAKLSKYPAYIEMF